MNLIIWLYFVVAPASSSMNAWVETNVLGKQEYQTNFPVPQLGDLHKKYSELPTECEYLIKVHASSVNPSDIRPGVSFWPHVMGSDMAGVVVQVGMNNCSRFTVGDRVYGDIGANAKSSKGVKTKELGGYGEYTLALETQLGRVPSNIDLAEAGSLPKVALTSYKALWWYAGGQNSPTWKNSPTVLVLGGSGGTGSTGIQLAKALGAGKVITTTSSSNFNYCKDLGADVLIDYHTQNWYDPAVVAANSVDVVYDTVGENDTGDRAMNVLKSGGFYVTITGQLANHVKPGVTQHMFINSDTNLSNEKEMDALTRLIESDKLRMRSSAVFANFTLSEMEQAFALSEKGHTVGKIVISI